MTDFDARARAREIACWFANEGSIYNCDADKHREACNELTSAISSALKEAVEDKDARISSLEQRVKELEEALEELIYEITHLSPRQEWMGTGEVYKPIIRCRKVDTARKLLCHATDPRADSQSSAQALPSDQTSSEKNA